VNICGPKKSSFIKQLHTSLLSAAEFPPWRNWLARLTVIRITRLIAHQEVESSSLSGGDNRSQFFLAISCLHMLCVAVWWTLGVRVGVSRSSYLIFWGLV
jgi:hypothetical protein